MLVCRSVPIWLPNYSPVQVFLLWCHFRKLERGWNWCYEATISIILVRGRPHNAFFRQMKRFQLNYTPILKCEIHLQIWLFFHCHVSFPWCKLVQFRLVNELKFTQITMRKCMEYINLSWSLLLIGFWWLQEPQKGQTSFFSCRYVTWISGILICLSWPLRISPYVRDGRSHWLCAYLFKSQND